MTRALCPDSGTRTTPTIRCSSPLGRAARVSPGDGHRARVACPSCHGAWAMDSSKAASGMAMNAPITAVLTTRDTEDETLTPTNARALQCRRQPARSAPLAGSVCPVSTNRGLYPVAVASRRNPGSKPGGVQGQDPANFDRVLPCGYGLQPYLRVEGRQSSRQRSHGSRRQVHLRCCMEVAPHPNSPHQRSTFRWRC